MLIKQHLERQLEGEVRATRRSYCSESCAYWESMPRTQWFQLVVTNCIDSRHPAGLVVLLSRNYLSSFGGIKTLQEAHKSEPQTRCRRGREISVTPDFFFFFFQRCRIFDADQVNIMKARKSNSALCVTPRPPRLAPHEQLQQKEVLRHWVICWNTIHQLKGGFFMPRRHSVAITAACCGSDSTHPERRALQRRRRHTCRTKLFEIFICLRLPELRQNNYETLCVLTGGLVSHLPSRRADIVTVGRAWRQQY